MADKTKYKLTPVSDSEQEKLCQGFDFFRDEEGTLFVRIFHRIGSYKDKIDCAYYYACELVDGEIVILKYVSREDSGLKHYRGHTQWSDPWHLPKPEEGMRGGPDCFTFSEENVEIVREE